MRDFPPILVKFLNSHFYSSQPSTPERVGLSWLPDEYEAIRTLLISETACSSPFITHDETFCAQAQEQGAHLIHQFPHFLHLEREGGAVFIDRLFHLRKAQYALYRHDRAHFYAWKLQIQQHDFSQIECAGESLAEYALLSRLEKLIRCIEASKKSQAVFINWDDLKNFFSREVLKKKIACFFNNYFVVSLTQQPNVEPISDLNDLSIMHYDPLLISFYDLVMQAASMTKTPIYPWYIPEFSDLSPLLAEYEESSPERTGDAIAKIEAIPALSNPLPITLKNKQPYLEKLCHFFFEAKDQPPILSAFSGFKQTREASVYLPENASASVKRIFDYVTRWDSTYGTCSYTLGDTKESFAVHSLFSQVLRLRDALIQSCYGESSYHLVVVDFDGTMTNSQTNEINGGLDNWITLLNECRSKFNVRFVFMTARPPFYAQHDKIAEVKTAISRGDLNMIGTCFLGGLACKADIIVLLRVMMSHCAPQLKVSSVLVDDNLLLELHPAQNKQIITVQSHNIPGTPEYTKFKESIFISTLFTKLTALTCGKLFTAAAAGTSSCHFTSPSQTPQKIPPHETNTSTL